MARRKGRKSGRRSGAGFRTYGGLVGAGVYGAGRQYLSALIQPVTRAIPLGTIADEVVLMFGTQWAAKRMGNGLLSNALRTGALIEASRIGAAIADGTAFMTGSSSSSGSAPTTVIG